MLIVSAPNANPEDIKKLKREIKQSMKDPDKPVVTNCEINIMTVKNEDFGGVQEE